MDEDFSAKDADHMTPYMMQMASQESPSGTPRRKIREMRRDGSYTPQLRLRGGGEPNPRHQERYVGMSDEALQQNRGFLQAQMHALSRGQINEGNIPPQEQASWFNDPNELRRHLAQSTTTTCQWDSECSTKQWVNGLRSESCGNPNERKSDNRLEQFVTCIDRLIDRASTVIFAQAPCSSTNRKGKQNLRLL